jgi:hypothetical protein
LLTGSAAASSASNPLQHGVSQGVRVDVYAPGRVVFDLTHANATVRGMLRGPQIPPGCVRARLVNGLWRAIDVGTTSPLRRRVQVDLAPTSAPPGAVGASLRVPYDGCEIGGLYGHRWNDAWVTRDAVEVWLTVRGATFSMTVQPRVTSPTSSAPGASKRFGSAQRPGPSSNGSSSAIPAGSSRWGGRVVAFPSTSSASGSDPGRSSLRRPRRRVADCSSSPSAERSDCRPKTSATWHSSSEGPRATALTEDSATSTSRQAWP